MAKIVISYRRADSEAITGRIRDRLVAHYGDESIFMDVDSIPYGIDFRDYIAEALKDTHAVIAVIGPQWAAEEGSGRSRLQEDADLVHIEVETALQRGIPVVPVLVNDAEMPRAEKLPDGLKPLLYRNAAQVDSGRDFHQHMDRLIRSMDKVLGSGAPAPAALTSAATVMPVASSAQAPQYNVRAAESPPQPVGTEPASGQAAAMPPGAGGTSSRRRWVVAALALGIVVAGAAATAFYFYRPGSRVAPQASTTPTAAPQAPSTTPAVTPAPPPQIRASAPTKCGSGPGVAFHDDFDNPAAGWGDTTPVRFFAGGDLVFKRAEPGWITWLYRPMRFTNADICTTIKSPVQAAKLDGKASGGLVFWAADYSNYYLAQIYLDGTYQIYRRLAEEWIAVVARNKSEAIRPGTGAINDLQVTTKDNNGTFYVNGIKVVDFRGQPPRNGGSVGLHGETEAEMVNEWRFQSLTVVDPAQPPPRPLSAKATAAATKPIACGPRPDAAFADDFKTNDPGWDKPSETFYYANQRMVLKPIADRVRALLYLSLRFGSAMACVNVISPTDPVQPNELSGGGIAFWAAGYRNYYSVSIFRDGTYDLFRFANDEWTPIMKRTASEAVKKGPDAVNQLKVQLVNNTGVLYINDVKMLEFWGQPPSAGGAVGLFASSDKERQNEWRFQSILVVD